MNESNCKYKDGTRKRTAVECFQLLSATLNDEKILNMAKVVNL